MTEQKRGVRPYFIPQADTTWVSDAKVTHRIIFADEFSVITESRDGRRVYMNLVDFHRYFAPVRNRVIHRKWVNLYKNGEIGTKHDSQEEAIKCAGHDRDQIAETRLLVWEVEE